MKRFLATTLVALALAACTDVNPVAVKSSPTAPRSELNDGMGDATVGPSWSIYTSQTPELNQDATSNPGWEVATQFHTSKPGKVIGFRFWRADGETGNNFGTLWTDSGQPLASEQFPAWGSGWQTVYLGTPIRISTNTNYRVSVNTNTAQVKTFGALQYGPIVNGPLTADYSYYGQPTGVMPTSGSYSLFFVDVIFQEDPPLPNLYFGSYIAVGGTNFQGQYIASFYVCNNGSATSAASTTRIQQFVSYYGGGYYWNQPFDMYTPSLAPGACQALNPPIYPVSGAHNEWHVWLDVNGQVAENNENDNYAYVYWNR